MAMRLPTVIVIAARAMTAQRHSTASTTMALPNSRTIRAKPAAFEAVERKAVIGSGAPSYASGAHMWNGAADTLKPTPASISINPTMMAGSVSDWARSPSAWAMPAYEVVWVTPYTRLMP